MIVNNTEPASTCQADQPDYLTIRHGDREYRLKWESGKGKYRLHLHHLPTLRDTYYSSDPAEAVLRATERLPKLLALADAAPSEVVEERPKHLLLTHKGVEYKLTLHKSGEYRRKFQRIDKYFGDSPATARDDFYSRIDGILAGRDPRFTPGSGAPIDEFNPTFEAMVATALAYKKSRIGISLGQDRYERLETTAKVIRETAASIETQLPNARIDRKLLATPAGDIKDRHLQDLIEKLRERHNLTTLDDDLQFLRFVFTRANRRLKSDDIELMVKETLASVPVDKKRAEQRRNQKWYSREEILAILDKADTQWKAMVLLGINGALEPNEVSLLDWSFVDLESGWYRKQRNKVEGAENSPRLFWYWPETLDALQVQPTRLKGGRVFLTSRGQPWIGGSKRSFHNEFTKLEERGGITHIAGRGFKGLRHSFRTFGDKCRIKEQFALDLIQGHKQKHNDMGRVYNGQQDDSMVKHYCNFVRAWLYDGENAAHKLTQQWTQHEGKAYYDMKFQVA